MKKKVLKIEQTINTIMRRSLIFSTLFSGVYFIIKSTSGPTITGAVIGSPVSKINLSLSIVLFLISISLAHFWEK